MSTNSATTDDNSVTKVEFAIQMKCNSCETKVIDELKKLIDVKIVDIDVDDQRLVVELKTNSTSVHEIQDTIESRLGFKTVVKGLGDSIAAVSEISGEDDIIGVVRFTQLVNNLCLVDGVVDGIASQKQYSVNIHEFGDISGQGFENVGKLYVPLTDQLSANDPGYPFRANFKAQIPNCDLSSCIGRSLVVSRDSRAIGAGVVARASSVGDNTKRICACSGRTLWEERAIKSEDRTSRL